MPVHAKDQSRHEHEGRRRSQESTSSGRRNLRHPRGSEGDVRSRASRQPTETSLDGGKTTQKDISEEKEIETRERQNDVEISTNNTNVRDHSGVDIRNDQTKEEADISSHTHKQTSSPPPTSGTSPHKQQPEVFTIQKFNRNMDDFVEVFTSDKFTHVTDEYPVEELVSVVSHVTTSVEEFKEQTVSSQRHLEELSETMRRVKEKIQMNIQRKSSIIRVGKFLFEPRLVIFNN